MKQPSPPIPHKRWITLRPALDALVTQYKTPDYILSDPIQFPYRYLDNARACEMTALLTALFSYGRREQIIVTLNRVFKTLGSDPIGFLEAFDAKRDGHLFESFVHRFNTGEDLIFLLGRLQQLYNRYHLLEDLMSDCLPTAPVVSGNSLQPVPEEAFRAGIGTFIDALLGENSPERYGLRFMMAHPSRGGACKRFNMFLRWMVRDDVEPSGRVDFGLWQKVLRPADLRIPLDAHVMNMNRQLAFSSRKDASWRTAEEITDVLRYLCPDDPIKYDYALFGFSLDKRALIELTGQEQAPKPARTTAKKRTSKIILSTR